MESPGPYYTFAGFLCRCLDEVSEEFSLPRYDSLSIIRCCPRCLASSPLRCYQLPRSWLADLSVVAQLLNFGALCYGRQPQPGPVHFPDKRQEHFIKALPEYHLVAPVRVDASGHFLSYGLYHLVSSSRRKRDLDDPEDRVYYRILHEEKDLLFNLTVNQGLCSKNYIVERRYGNLSHVKMEASSGTPCHLRGTVLQQGTRVGTAALSACHGLVSHPPPLP
ncbi:a disintegrin and metalloproteinase with thrombospondin motifs 7-like protein [Camelus ferus]|nr:a disintegrin and metalloproteinase with thrombospondin motifs 7-like protein [Camelus ferus]